MEPASSSNLAIFAFLILLPIAPCIALTPPPSPNLEVAGAIAPPPPEKPSSSFKPGVAVLVCILTTIFSLTFLLLLYIKHCNAGSIESPGSIAGGGNSTSRAVPPLSGRKNSGIDRSVVESLPVFRFRSLRGQKEGLDCAVCLMKFEAAEVLRLLPKCKHAFHVECVDTWLDAHSTCPLCRYRVDPEDILLIEESETKVFRENEGKEKEKEKGKEWDLERGKASAEQCGRRHSSVEEREREPERKSWTASFRRSLDSATSRKKSESVGCFVRARKDGMLLANGGTEEKERARRSVESKRLEHRIIVSGPGPGPVAGPERERGIRERWSDVEASELLYLTSEMIMSGRGMINSRSVSEITGLSRFSLTNHNQSQVNREQAPQQDGGREREEGLVRRWLAWISKSRTQPDVR